MSKEELLLKNCVRGMKTIIEESKPKKSSFKISVEIPDEDEKMEEPEEHSWLYFNNLFKEK